MNEVKISIENVIVSILGFSRETEPLRCVCLFVCGFICFFSAVCSHDDGGWRVGALESANGTVQVQRPSDWRIRKKQM